MVKSGLLDCILFCLLEMRNDNGDVIFQVLELYDVFVLEMKSETTTWFSIIKSGAQK